MQLLSRGTSTQEFTEIQDIQEDLVLFSNGKAALAIEVSSTNFSLLSREEQDSRVGAYASFLNSLSFPIQIIVMNKRVDITAYVTLLETEINKLHDEKVVIYMQKYKDFVQQLVKQNTVLDKHFYIVVSYSYYEGGMGKNNNPQNISSDFFSNAKAALHTKAEGLRNQLTRINLPTRILNHDELAALFGHIYSPETAQLQTGETIA